MRQDAVVNLTMATSPLTHTTLLQYKEGSPTLVPPTGGGRSKLTVNIMQWKKAPMTEYYVKMLGLI